MKRGKIVTNAKSFNTKAMHSTKLLVQSFHERCSSGLYTLKFYQRGLVAEELNVFETLSIIKALTCDYFITRVTNLFKPTSP